MAFKALKLKQPSWKIYTKQTRTATNSESRQSLTVIFKKKPNQNINYNQKRATVSSFNLLLESILKGI